MPESPRGFKGIFTLPCVCLLQAYSSSMDLDFKCESCGKKQEKNKDKSNENWEVFDVVPCECGGTFKPVLRDK